MNLRFTAKAAAELEELIGYVGERSAVGARRLMARIKSTAELLQQFPHAGRQTSKRGMRRIVARPYPYLIFYRLDADGIVVHGVRHGARRPSSMPR